MLEIEWAGLTPELVLISTPERQWVHRNRAWGPFARPMTGPGSKATTRGLLDGAARMGWAAAGRRAEPPLTPLRWAYRLCGFYLTTHATPPLMREAAARFTAASRPELAAWAETKAREEQGHDALALADLRALGHPAEAVARLAPAIPAALVRKFEELVRSDHPVRCVGYTYALERLALEVDGAYIAAVEACLPPGLRATRCLRVHSAVGSDRAHVDETVELVATLPPAERASIALACYETSLLCCASDEGAPLTDENLGRLFASLRNERTNPDEQ